MLVLTIASLLYLLVQFRFALLNVAALEAPLVLKLDEGLFGDDCIFIANDWHGALVPVYLAAKYRPHGVYHQARSILAVHNLRHQVHCFVPHSACLPCCGGILALSLLLSRFKAMVATIVCVVMLS